MGKKSKPSPGKYTGRLVRQIGTKLTEEDYERWKAIIPRRSESLILRAFAHAFMDAPKEIQEAILRYAGSQQSINKPIDSNTFMQILSGRKKY